MIYAIREIPTILVGVFLFKASYHIFESENVYAA